MNYYSFREVFKIQIPLRMMEVSSFILKDLYTLRIAFTLCCHVAGITEDFYAEIMRTSTCYDIIPSSTKIVVFDTRLRVSYNSDVYYCTSLFHCSPGEEGILRSGCQWPSCGSSVGQLQTDLCGYADHHRLHQHPQTSLQISNCKKLL